MKKLLILTAIGAMVAMPGYGAFECAPFDKETTTCYGQSYYGVDWSARCETDENLAYVYGVSACSNYQGASEFAVTASLDAQLPTIDNIGDTDNMYCWCRMVYPVTSTWVYVWNSNGQAGNCQKNCSGKCVDLMLKNADFRAAIYSKIY